MRSKKDEANISYTDKWTRLRPAVAGLRRGKQQFIFELNISYTFKGTAVFDENRWSYLDAKRSVTLGSAHHD